jgi:hypothetical protein
MDMAITNLAFDTFSTLVRYVVFAKAEIRRTCIFLEHV